MSEALSDHEILRQLQDREEITQVLHDFARGVDLLDLDAVARCFAADVRWDYGPGAGRPITGRDTLKAFIGEAFSKREVTDDSLCVVRIKRTSHHISNIRIDFTGPDTARSEAYTFTWHEMAEGERPGLVWGRWHDRWVRTPGEGWQIADRKMLVAATDNYYAIGYSVWDVDVPVTELAAG
jgi:hypothetical protein